jgi:hypothetical protein
MRVVKDRMMKGNKKTYEGCSENSGRRVSPAGLLTLSPSFINIFAILI